MKINDYLGLLIIVAWIIKSFFDYLKVKDPKMAEKFQIVDDIAEWAVSLQATKDISNAQKQVNATQAVVEQAKKVGVPITETSAKGAVEKAVAEKKSIPQPEPVKASEIKSAPVPAVTITEQDDRLDDLHL
ncbi:phage holin, LLH family [Lactobacillus jensenii]|uniref:phage holin, LLH family n=1 Tax=Lactobacillus jensenii TaxID=109790 RepID=UPI001F37C3ED|nr:phage holin, LLH family [Lactobacillus jensenii]MCF1778138.1 phage holin family protein [Lactobacillus jensenii]